MSYSFKLEEWLPRFPLQDDQRLYTATSIIGPGDICNNEQLRREMQDQYDWGPAVPTDIFVMSDGEPLDRSVTKIGGLPYRLDAQPWPSNEDGVPMLFLAQFNFSESRNIYPDLPGDLLLVFTDELESEINMLHMEWQMLGASDLIAAKDVPPHRNSFLPCFGATYRTVSYPEATRKVAYEIQKYPTCHGKEVWRDYLLLQYEATQIGPAPFLIQIRDYEVPGGPLCTIASVYPSPHKPFPWLNHPEPLMPEDKWDFNTAYFTFGDTGCVYISIDEENQLHWDCACY